MLKTVAVPKEFTDIFKSAEESVGSFFKNQEVDVSKGSIEISGERYLLVRASSLSVDFFECVMGLYRNQKNEDALEITRQLLFDSSHAIGMKDAEHFCKEMKLETSLEKLAAGPVHFSYTGWAFVKIYPESRPTPDENFLVVFDHPYSFEADSWIKAGKKSDTPVCIMNSGYSSGWSEYSFGIPLVSVELTCRAKGDEKCHFIMAHALRIEEALEEYLKKNPKLNIKRKQIAIPAFFKNKKAEAALKQSNEKLKASNKELILKSTALAEKSYMIELLSQTGGLLQACRNKEDVFEIFSTYATKLFPKYKGHLYIFQKDKNNLEGVASWGTFSTKKPDTFSAEDCWGLRENKIHLQSSSEKHRKCSHVFDQGVESICVPISSGEDKFGLIWMNIGFTSLTHDESTILSRLASDIGVTLSNIQLRDTLRDLSIKDYLTGIYNRRYMEAALKQEVVRAKRNSSSLGIILFDIDHYKEFNDIYGHEAGDYVLKTLGNFLTSFFRESDIVCRYGGEEFLIILKDSDLETTTERAEALRKEIKSIPLHYRNKDLGSLKISLGVSLFPEHGKTPGDLLDAADIALYQAKNNGRDQICLASA